MRQTAFVLMPFTPELEEVYNLFIADTLVAVGYDVKRADDIVSGQNILKDIVEAIRDSDLIVADLTNSNPNVYYELGLAHCFDKPVILLAQDINELPFDLRSYRVVVYNTHFAAVHNAREELRTLALGARDRTIAFGNPVRDFAPSTTDPRTTVKTESTFDDGEPGFLDYLVDMEDGMTKITEIVNTVGDWVAGMGDATREVTLEIEAAQANGGSGTPRQIQKLARRLGVKQDELARNLSTANSQYRDQLSGLENSIEGVIAAQEPSSPEECNALREFLSSLGKSEDAAFEGRQSFAGMATTMDNIPKMERHLTRATQSAAIEVRHFIDNVDQTLAVFARARTLGERILRQSGCE